MRIVIVGNGILATTLAFRLINPAASNDEVVLVGPYARGGSASLAAAAMLNSFAEIEAGSLDTEVDRYRFDLSRHATAEWVPFEEELSAAAGNGTERFGPQSSAGRVSRGTYIVNNAAAESLDDENFDAIVGALEAYQEPFSFVSAGDIPHYKPTQRDRALRALFLNEEGWVNPRLTVDKLDFVLSQSPKVTMVDARVQRVIMSSGIVSSVELEDGTNIEGDKFVLATGATVSSLLDESDLGIRVQRVFSGAGVSVEISSPGFAQKSCIRTPNRGLACGVYSAPYDGAPGEESDHVLIGASNLISATPILRPRLSSVDTVIQGAIDQINTDYFRADLVRVNLGLRPSSQDTYPMLGQTSIPNFLMATGTKRDGFHLAPFVSKLLSDLINGKAVDPKFEWFRPDRPLLKTLTREQAIAKGIRHRINASYQHGYNAPTGRLTDQIAAMHREDLERVHDAVGAVDWGIPPEMIDMYRYGHAVA